MMESEFESLRGYDKIKNCDTIPTRYSKAKLGLLHTSVAQLVEHRIPNPGVGGSNPSWSATRTGSSVGRAGD